MDGKGFTPSVMEVRKAGLLSDKVAAGAGWDGAFDCPSAPETSLERFVFRGTIDSPGCSEALSVYVSSVPATKNHAFSLHRSSPITLLPESQRQKGICVDILAAQDALIPDETPVGSSLSGAVLPKCEKTLQPLCASERTTG